MDCSLPGSSIRGVLQARILEWVAISFSRRYSQPRDQTWVSCSAGRRFTIWALDTNNQGGVGGEGRCLSKGQFPTTLTIRGQELLEPEGGIYMEKEHSEFWQSSWNWLWGGLTCTILIPLCVCVLVAQSCLTLCNPPDCSLPGFSVHGILQARILEWIAIPFSRGTSHPRNRTLVSCMAGRFFTIWAKVNLHFQSWFVPISLGPILGINFFHPVRVSVSIRQLRDKGSE